MVARRAAIPKREWQRLSTKDYRKFDKSEWYVSFERTRTLLAAPPIVLPPADDDEESNGEESNHDEDSDGGADEPQHEPPARTLLPEVRESLKMHVFEVAAANGVPASVCQMLADAIEDGGLADRPAQVPANLLMNMDETA